MRSDDEIRTLVRERYGAIAQTAGASCCAPSSCGCSGSAEMAPDGLNVIGDAYAAWRAGSRRRTSTSAAACRPGTRRSGAARPCSISARAPATTSFIARHEVGPEGPRDRGRHDARHDRQGTRERRKARLRQRRVPARRDRAAAGRGRQRRRRDQQLRAQPRARQGARVRRDGPRAAARRSVLRLRHRRHRRAAGGVRDAAGLYVGCVAGAMPETDYLGSLEAAGFQDVAIVEAKPIELPDEALSPHMPVPRSRLPRLGRDAQERHRTRRQARRVDGRRRSPCVAPSRPTSPVAAAGTLRERACHRGAGYGHRAEPASGRHGARPDADPGLGLVLLFAGGARAGDRDRYRMVAGLDCRRPLPWPDRSRLCLAAGRPHDRAPRWPACPGRERCPLRGGAVRPGGVEARWQGAVPRRPGRCLATRATGKPKWRRWRSRHGRSISPIRRLGWRSILTNLGMP